MDSLHKLSLINKTSISDNSTNNEQKEQKITAFFSHDKTFICELGLIFLRLAGYRLRNGPRRDYGRHIQQSGDIKTRYHLEFIACAYMLTCTSVEILKKIRGTVSNRLYGHKIAGYRHWFIGFKDKV